MGLDQYAYVAARANQQAEFWESAEIDPVTKDYNSRSVEKPRELAYWRKHPNLQGWMRQLWVRKGKVGPSDDPTFNGVELELTWEDLDELEYVVKNSQLPSTTGFFFGDQSDDYYKNQDLEFIRNARAELFCGLKVFYNSSW
jgi:hypothetical protein